MKTLVVAPQPFFSPRGTPFSVYYRTLISRELGLDIDFLTYGQGQDVDIPGVRFHRIPAFSMLGKIKIGPSVLKLFHDFFLFFAMLRLLLSEKFAVVHAHEEAVFFALMLKPFFGYKLIYDMHSSLPQQMTNFNYTSSKLIIGIFTWLENRSLAASDLIITICPDLYNYVNSVLPGNNKNFLIENSILEPVRLAANGDKACEERQDERQEQGEIPVDIPAEFTDLVVYAGTLEVYQGIDILIKSVKGVVAEKPHTFFLIAGGSPQQVKYYSALADSLGVSAHILFTGQLPQEEARACNGKATVLVSPRSSGTNTPLKIYEQLASGKPLVATSIHSHTQVLSDKVAFLVEPEAESMTAGILLALEPQAAEKAKAARELYDQEYARPVYVRKLKTALEVLS